MKRKDFIKNGVLSSLIAMVAPSVLKADTKVTSDEKETTIKTKLGHNHMPNSNMNTMNSVLHKANTRGSADHGWLKVNHTFSFANYQNPDRMNFGALRVLNDDTISGGMGFNPHPHNNMEIITIPLEGSIKHKDDMGNSSVIACGDVQVMSAGKGVVHSEFNADENDDLKLLQIWLFANKKNVEPRYQQIPIRDVETKNEFYQILSPNNDDQGVWIHQNAWFHLGEFNQTKKANYKIHSSGNGIYAFIIKGKAQIENQSLENRDGFGIWNTDSITIQAEENSKILLMEVPMKI
jgi:redox-sensitive bicupin YhaK (pirin superfamily)